MEKKGREDEERARKMWFLLANLSRTIVSSIQLDFPVANGNTTSLLVPVAKFSHYVFIDYNERRQTMHHTPPFLSLYVIFNTRNLVLFLMAHGVVVWSAILLV